MSAGALAGACARNRARTQPARRGDVSLAEPERRPT